LLSNRSLLYLTKKDYVNALVDAETCIEINPCFWKGHYRKAYAIANLIKRKMIPAEMESAGLCCEINIFKMNGDICFAIKLKFKIIHRNGRNE
jgi:hypothetical protein